MIKPGQNNVFWKVTTVTRGKTDSENKTLWKFTGTWYKLNRLQSRGIGNATGAYKSSYDRNRWNDKYWNQSSNCYYVFSGWR